MKRKPSMAVVPAERNVEIRLAVTKWKLYTGKTQQDLADQLGIPPSYLCDILYGRRPGRKYIPRITEITEKFAS